MFKYNLFRQPGFTKLCGRQRDSVGGGRMVGWSVRARGRVVGGDTTQAS